MSEKKTRLKPVPSREFCIVLKSVADAGGTNADALEELKRQGFIMSPESFNGRKTALKKMGVKLPRLKHANGFTRAGLDVEELNAIFA